MAATFASDLPSIRLSGPTIRFSPARGLMREKLRRSPPAAAGQKAAPDQHRGAAARERGQQKGRRAVQPGNAGHSQRHLQAEVMRLPQKDAELQCQAMRRVRRQQHQGERHECPAREAASSREIGT